MDRNKDLSRKGPRNRNQRKVGSSTQTRPTLQPNSRNKSSRNSCIIISEVHWNPSGTLQGQDSKHEFIEIRNVCNEFVDLKNWRIKINTADDVGNMNTSYTRFKWNDDWSSNEVNSSGQSCTNISDSGGNTNWTIYPVGFQPNDRMIIANKMTQHAGIPGLNYCWNVFEWDQFTGAGDEFVLSNNYMRIQLMDQNQNVVDTVEYCSSPELWCGYQSPGDASGPSAELMDSQQTPDPLGRRIMTSTGWFKNDSGMTEVNPPKYGTPLYDNTPAWWWDGGDGDGGHGGGQLSFCDRYPKHPNCTAAPLPGMSNIEMQHGGRPSNKIGRGGREYTSCWCRCGKEVPSPDPGAGDMLVPEYVEQECGDNQVPGDGSWWNCNQDNYCIAGMNCEQYCQEYSHVICTSYGNSPYDGHYYGWKCDTASNASTGMGGAGEGCCNSDCFNYIANPTNPNFQCNNDLCYGCGDGGFTPGGHGTSVRRLGKQQKPQQYKRGGKIKKNKQHGGRPSNKRSNNVTRNINNIDNSQTEITLTGTIPEMTQQLINIPGIDYAMNRLNMTPDDLLQNIYGAVRAMDTGQTTRFPSCSSGQSFCNGSGLCTGPACFKDCNKYASGASTGGGFNMGFSGQWGGASVDWEFGAYQGGGNSMGTTWTCSVGMSW